MTDTRQVPQWEIDFDKRFVDVYKDIDGGTAYQEFGFYGEPFAVKQFIRSQITTAYEQGKKDKVVEVRKELETTRHQYSGRRFSSHAANIVDDNRFFILTDVLSIPSLRTDKE